MSRFFCLSEMESIVAKKTSDGKTWEEVAEEENISVIQAMSHDMKAIAIIKSVYKITERKARELLAASLAIIIALNSCFIDNNAIRTTRTIRARRPEQWSAQC